MSYDEDYIEGFGVEDTEEENGFDVENDGFGTDEDFDADFLEDEDEDTEDFSSDLTDEE